MNRARVLLKIFNNFFIFLNIELKSPFIPIFIYKGNFFTLRLFAVALRSICALFYRQKYADATHRDIGTDGTYYGISHSGL